MTSRRVSGPPRHAPRHSRRGAGPAAGTVVAAGVVLALGVTGVVLLTPDDRSDTPRATPRSSSSPSDQPPSDQSPSAQTPSDQSPSAQPVTPRPSVDPVAEPPVAEPVPTSSTGPSGGPEAAGAGRVVAVGAARPDGPAVTVPGPPESAAAQGDPVVHPVPVGPEPVVPEPVVPEPVVPAPAAPVLLARSVGAWVPAAVAEVLPTGEASLSLPIPGSAPVGVSASLAVTAAPRTPTDPVPPQEGAAEQGTVVEVSVVVTGGGRHAAAPTDGSVATSDAAPRPGGAPAGAHVPRHLAG